MSVAKSPVAKFAVTPKGTFNLEAAQDYFGGWPTLDGDIVMAFPVDGGRGSAAVVMRQNGARVHGEVFGSGADADAERAWLQALATVSLDVDGRRFVDVARRDPVVGRLWTEHRNLRPIQFHSAYEAASAFIIGHRMTIAQTRKTRQRMAEEVGATIAVGASKFHAFPAPRSLLKLESFPGIAAPKIERLHAVAEAALQGRLDRDRLRTMPEADALADLRELPGVGGFFAEGILSRGAGLADYVPDEDLTPRAVELAYGLRQRPDRGALLERAEGWRPYRMWAVVLLHVWLRRQPRSVIGPRRLGRGRSNKR